MNEFSNSQRRAVARMKEHCRYDNEVKRYREDEESERRVAALNNRIKLIFEGRQGGIAPAEIATPVTSFGGHEHV